MVSAACGVVCHYCSGSTGATKQATVRLHHSFIFSFAAATVGRRGSGRRRKASALEGRIVTAEGIQLPTRKTLPVKNSDHEADEKWRVAVTRQPTPIITTLDDRRHC